MSHRIVGADVAALRAFARALQLRGNEIGTTRGHLGVTIESLPWAGLDRERFVGEWHGVHAPALAAAVSDMLAAADQANYHARRQEQASRSNGG